MNAAHVRAEAAISTRNGFTVDFAGFAIGFSATLGERSAAVVTFISLLRIDDSDRGAIRYRLIGMRNIRDNRYGEREGQGKDYRYLFHDRVPLSDNPYFGRTRPRVSVTRNMI